MISFKPKKYVERDLLEEAIDYLEKSRVPFVLISEDEADEISKVNSKSMVLREFKQNAEGKFQITVQEKEGYRYTSKLLGNCGLRSVVTDPKTKKTTGIVDYLGKALSTIEILALHYNLSVVKK